MRNYTNVLTVPLLCLLIASLVLAQTGGQYTIEQSVISNGGGISSGGTFGVTGTIGQPVAGNALTGSPFSLTSGFWNFTPAAPLATFEADLAPRPSGDAVYQSNDVVQARRFLIGLDTPDQSNEFQRLDSAPFATLGDGLIQANDVVQARRYLIGLEAQQSAGGPTSFGPAAVAGSAVQPTASKRTGLVVPREVRVESATAPRGQLVTINIRTDTLGDEAGFSFRLNYNSAILQQTPITTVAGSGGSRLCNTAVAGQVTCSVDSFPNDQPGSSDPQIGEIAAGNNLLLLSATFRIIATATLGSSPLTLTNVSESNDAAMNLVPVTITNGTVTVTAPTASFVGVGGQVRTAEGGGIGNVRVTMTDQNGTGRETLTNPFGYFRFDSVEVGQLYIIGVQSRRFQFANPTQAVSVGDEVTDLVFTALPR